jgi:hypothetical protein
MIGLIARAAGKQKDFQANSCYDKRVFSEVYLGMLIIKYEPAWIKGKDVLIRFKHILGDLSYE